MKRTENSYGDQLRKKSYNMEDLFIIQHFVKDGKHYLNFVPKEESEGYPPKEIEVSENQWNQLKFHFGMAQNGKGLDKLCYLAGNL